MVMTLASPLPRLTLACLAASLAFLSPASAQQVPDFGPSPPPYVQTGPIALVGGTVIDATGAPPKPDHTVIIDHGKIVAVGPSASVAVPAGARTFDAHGMTVMPGLISSNQHIQLNPLHPAPAADLPIAELHARWQANFAEMPRKSFIYLMQGITTMRQTSGPLTQLLPIKKRIDAGEIPGPRILLGGALLISPQYFAHYIKQNHTPPDAVNWLRNEFAFRILDDVDRDTDALLGEDINFWKIVLSDEVFDGSNDFTDEQIKTIIAKAHKAGKPVDIHANATPEGFARLLKFDFNTLEHPFQDDFLLDEKTVAGFASKGIIVDTLLQSRIAGPNLAMDPDRLDETAYIMSSSPEEYRQLMNYRDKLLHLRRNPDLRGLSIYDKRASASSMFGQKGPSYNDLLKGRELARANMRLFIKKGVKFATGTDSPTFLNFLQENPYALEMESMVEMGMTPMDAIIASTRNGAEIAGMLDTLGTIEVGKTADVIVVAGDPLKSISAMKRVAVVIKDGVRYK